MKSRSKGPAALDRAAPPKGGAEWRSIPLIAIVLAVIVLVLQARVVLGGKTWDDLRYHTEVAPPRLAAADSILAGELPTWWDGSGLGVPLLGEPSHGAAYPGVWISPTPHALDLVWILHLLWLALGVALWARRLGAGEVASVLGAVLAAASGIAVSTALRGALPALAHLPWVGLAATSLATLRESRLRSTIVMALALAACGLAGQLAIFVDAIVLAIVCGARRDAVRWLAVGVMAGVLVSAIQWIPAAFVIAESTGAEVGAMKLSRLLELVVPGSFGSVHPDRAVAQLAGASPVLPSLFAGAALFAFAALARPGRRIAILAGVLVALALVVGRGGWPAWLGAPDLHLAVVCVLAAAYAGRGIEVLLAAERRAVYALAGAGIASALALGGLAVLHMKVDTSAALDRALVDGGLGVLCFVIAAVLAWRGTSTTTRLVAALLAVAPTVGALGTTAPLIDRDIVETPSPWVDAALTTQQSKAPLRVFRPLSLFDERTTTLVPDALATLGGTSAWKHGIATARSEDPARLPVHDRVWLGAAAAGGALLERYAIAVAILPLVMVEGRGLVELARRGDSALVRYPAAPPAAMVSEWIWIADEAATITRLFPPGAGRGLPSGLVVLRGQGSEQQDEPSLPEPCLVARWTGGAIDLTCNAEGDVYAVVASSPAPGWTVHVDGTDTRWVTADLLQRAVPLAQGPHLVSWRYAAPGLVLGAIVAALGALVLVATALVTRRRRRTPDPASRETS